MELSFWNITLLSPLKVNQCLVGICCFCLQDLKVRQTRKFLGLHFNHKGDGDTLLTKIFGLQRTKRCYIPEDRNFRVKKCCCYVCTVPKVQNMKHCCKNLLKFVGAWLDILKQAVFLPVGQYWKKGLFVLLEDQECQSY
jgi:hypothetical protein